MVVQASPPPPSDSYPDKDAHHSVFDFIRTLSPTDQKFILGFLAVGVTVCNRLGDFVLFVPHTGSFGDGLTELVSRGSKGEPAPWSLFLNPPFSLPGSPADADSRVKANLQFFARNYFLLTAAAWIAFVSRRPSAGITAALLAAWRFIPRRDCSFRVPIVARQVTVTEESASWAARGALVLAGIVGFFSGAAFAAIKSVL